MGQAISLIIKRFSGGRRIVEIENPVPNEDYSLPSVYYSNNNEEHNNLNDAETMEDGGLSFVAITQQPAGTPTPAETTTQAETMTVATTVSDQLVEDDLQLTPMAIDFTINTVGGGGNTEVQEKAVKEERIISVRNKMSTKKRRKNKRQKKEAVRKIGPYASTHKVLLVGEADFSFSASLAVAFGYAPRIVATSLNGKDFLRKYYKNAMANIEELENRGASVIHRVDATQMAGHNLLSGKKFDRIIFNFPHSGSFGRTASEISPNQTLVSEFLSNAKKMIVEDGEIHVTHRTSRTFIKWKIVQLALKEGLYLIEEAPFDPGLYPGYVTKYGFKRDNNFDCYPCKTYKFGLQS